MGLESKLHQCEASLVNSWEMLNEERLEHRACQEALTFERERHKDTIKLLGQVFEEATRSGEIADSLGSKLAELQAASSFGVAQATPQTMASTETSQSNTSSTPPETSTLDSAERLPETGSSPGLKHSSEDEQAIQLSNVDASDGLECEGPFPIHAQPLPLAEPKSSGSSARGRIGGRKSKPRPVARKRTGWPQEG